MSILITFFDKTFLLFNVISHNIFLAKKKGILFVILKQTM